MVRFAVFTLILGTLLAPQISLAQSAPASRFPARAGVSPTSSRDLVTLVGSFFDEPPPGGCLPIGNAVALNSRVLGDGSTQPFSIPANRTLVLTGLDFTIGGSPGPDTVFLDVVNGDHDARIYTGVVAGELGAVSVALSGLSIEPGGTLCFSKSGSWRFANVYVRGFLTSVN